jgi:chaperonin cofactor prefoldin
MSISGEDYLTLKYDRLSPLLLQAIKELNNKYNALEDKHRILEEKYNKLEYIINNNII